MGNDAKVLLNKTTSETLPLLTVLDFDPRAHRPRRGQHRAQHLTAVVPAWAIICWTAEAATNVLSEPFVCKPHRAHVARAPRWAFML